MSGKRSGKSVPRGVQETQIAADRSKQRRAKYADDPVHAEKTRSENRTRYQDAHPRPASRLANGLLARGSQREIFSDDLDHPVTRETYTIPEAAEALGKSLATLRRWIAADKVPAPFYWETTRQTRVYTEGEVQVLQGFIARHEDQFVYLGSQHTHVIESLHQAVHAYRAEFI